MQTFLPYADFYQSALSLDYRRLGKQRIEVLQILRSLNGETDAWKRHIVVKMWEGYENALARYGVIICSVWICKGYKDTCLNRIKEYISTNNFEYPWWLGQEKFHLSHRSNLIRKNKEFYCKLWPDIPDNIPYIWPVK